METAGKEDMPEDAERKGLGTPATRAGILEKLVSAGFLERKKSRKTVQLLPSHDAVSLITVLPEQPGGVFGRDQHHAERSGGDLSGHQGN